MRQRLIHGYIHRIFMAPEGDPAIGGGEIQITPDIARTYLSDRVADPESLKTMAEPELVGMYTKSKPVYDKIEARAAEGATAKWREAIAGDDKAHLETLNRFASPKAMYDSYTALRTKVSNGELKAVTPFPDKGTPEEQTAWRQNAGVPDKPEAYEIKLPAGLELGEADKAPMDGFKKYAFENNLPASTVNSVVNWWAGARKEATEGAAARFEESKQQTAAILGKEWGADYNPNMNRIKGLLQQTLPSDEAGQKLNVSIMRAIETDPMFARHYAALALELNPAGALISGDRGATEGSITDELKKIDAMMVTNRAAYNKDDKAQARYRELLQGYEKLTGKGWNPHAKDA